MDEARWNARLDELDTEICAAQDVSNNAYWPAVAIALTLIDAGLIDRGKLIAITELLRDYVTTNSEPGTAEETSQSFDEFHHWLSMPLQPNDIQRQLEHLEKSALHAAFQRRFGSKKP